MRKFVFIIIICSLCFFNIFKLDTFATKYTMPSKIRVGLAFEDSYGYLSLKDSATVSNSKGIKLIWEFNSNANEITTSDYLSIKKSSLITSFVPLKVDEQKPSSNYLNVPKEYGFLGTFTIKFNQKFTSFVDSTKYIQNMKAAGKYAFPMAIEDGFYVCIGGFKTKADAGAAINEIVKNNLSVFSLSPISLDNVVLVSDSSKRFIFAADTSKGCCVTEFADSSELLALNDVKYRGSFEFKMISNKGLQIVNIAPFERYLYSVVPAEIGSSSHPEALKAQAVIARNYAYNNLNRHNKQGFALCSSVHCQAYKGYSIEAKSSNQAVIDTKNLLLTYNGKPAQCYYYSSSGGMTEDVQYVWGNTDIPYLKSVEDKYETNTTTNYTWSKTFTFDEVTKIMSNKGLNIGNVTNIKINKKSPAGRPYNITVVGTKGTKEYKNESCRTFLSLPSQFYKLTITGGLAIINSDEKKCSLGNYIYIQNSDGVIQSNSIKGMKVINGNEKITDIPDAEKDNQFVFNGKGWGHAVGLSQNGARGMANNGFDFKQILQHYFTGTVVE